MGWLLMTYKVESYVKYIKDIYNGKYDLNKFEENNKKEIKKIWNRYSIKSTKYI